MISEVSNHQKYKSNLLKICNTDSTSNLNSSFFLMEDVHIWHKHCLWCLNYNIGFIYQYDFVVTCWERADLLALVCGVLL